MTTSTTIPVTVTPEAGARIEDILYDRYELGDEPGLSVDIYSRHPSDPGGRFTRDLDQWFVRAFPSEVLEHVIMDYQPGEAHAG